VLPYHTYGLSSKGSLPGVEDDFHFEIGSSGLASATNQEERETLFYEDTCPPELKSIIVKEKCGHMYTGV